ncbi:hypothetical protein B0H13DRAFT_1142162 [Mycena leptocephala]|nr:hypothetical protein B0H13DRAFT_1142162 [Mycena leptocephala]
MISVNIKHSGKSYTLNLDPDLPAKAFKEEVYQVTGIPVDRMKVMVKGGVLKVCFRATYIFFPIAFATVRAAWFGKCRLSGAYRLHS